MSLRVGFECIYLYSAAHSSSLSLCFLCTDENVMSQLPAPDAKPSSPTVMDFIPLEKWLNKLLFLYVLLLAMVFYHSLRKLTNTGCL